MADALSVALLTREYPPDVYGGAGVHVEYLARELARLAEVTVHCWGAPRPPAGPGEPRVVAHEPWAAVDGPAPYLAALRAMSIDLTMAAGVDGTTLVHSHTWYASLGGHLAKLIHGVPHVATVHSLEPLRPWKEEQLGGGYRVSSFCERTGLEGADAVIAVSSAMRDDILAAYPAIDPERVTVIGNGIDTAEFQPDRGTSVLTARGIDPGTPSVVFVGRITRQKGLRYLLDAALDFEPGTQLVVCAGAPDTPELHDETAAKVESLRAAGRNVLWIEAVLPRPELIQIVSNASVFVCPSVYEPLGIVNLEAMACETAVVATRTGGIPEVVEEGVTGLLVPLELAGDGSGEPADPARFSLDIAERVNALLAEPALAERFGRAGRVAAVERFGWAAIAERVLAVYRKALA
ncbi:MAG TPA: glycogen synthase [Gaiellaceae bacterium]|nr:glycogen synthase [Gaiellaceae bacterium]